LLKLETIFCNFWMTSNLVKFSVSFSETQRLSDSL
jgi:hypothetical protein